MSHRNIFIFLKSHRYHRSHRLFSILLSPFTIDLRSSLLTLDIAQTSLALLSLTRSLHLSPFTFHLSPFTIYKRLIQKHKPQVKALPSNKPHCRRK